jgi:CheY-like chemotaxis protein
MQKKVLIVDDDPLIGSVYGYLLTSAGLKVRFARNAIDALGDLKQFEPDVVLLDLDLPDVNGIEWLREVRTYPKMKNLAVIIFTTGAHASQVQDALASDAMFVLGKGETDPEVVVRAILKAANAVASRAA